MTGWRAAFDQRAPERAQGQRERAAQAAVVLATYAAFAALQQVGIHLGLVDPVDCLWLTAWTLAGGIGFYAAIRSGLTLRVLRDPALALPQMLWAMVGIAWSYAITGPARGAVLPILPTVMLYGAFSWTAARARAMAILAISLLGGTMAWKVTTDPVRYDPRIEAVHLVSVAILMVTAAAMAVQFSRLRERLRSQRAQLADALERIHALATHDELTGLLNRRAIVERLGRELRDRVDPASPLCVAMIDLDHFKRFNDDHGHAGGDRALLHFAEQAGAVLRGDRDLLARWGGEEFLLAMPDSTLEQGLRCLQRVRHQLGLHPLDELASGLVVRFSAGVAECRRDESLEAAIARADAAMYRAKQAGRDRAASASAAPASADLVADGP